MKRLLIQCAVALGACLILAVVLMSQAQARNPRGAVSGSPFIGSCPVTVGTLTLAATTPRSTGISPLLVFFDATGTTDSATLTGANNPFQDISYTWNFGDGGTSGTSTWAYGSNPGVNSRNTATGAIAAHLYITSGADAPYTATVTANDGTNTAQCNVAVTAYDPAGVNGFPGLATTCVAQSTLPVAGSGGCPASAGVLTQSNFNTAISTKGGAGKRVLFKCGDTFTGTDASLGGTKSSYGAYGGCEGTQTSRPIIDSSATSNGAFYVLTSASDVRISDFDCQGAGTGHACVWTPGTYGISNRVTIFNVNCAGNSACFGWGQGAQYGLIGSVQVSSRSIGTFPNYTENNPPYSGNTINNLDYGALLGNSLAGPGCCGTGSGIEALRISAGRLYSITNNTISDANNTGAPFKIHGGNTNGSCFIGSGNPCNGTSPYHCPLGLTNIGYETVNFSSIYCWTGDYTELFEISDNLIKGNGGDAFEIAPQNTSSDERMRYFVVERNYFNMSTIANGGLQAEINGSNLTFRNNAFNMTQSSSTQYPIVALGVGERGIYAPNSSTVEVYNNTFYSPNSHGQTAIVFGAVGDLTPGAGNSFALNNLVYFSAGGAGTITNTGSGNTVSNNTTTVTTNPAFTDGSGTFANMSDFKPTANYSGGATVPNYYDAFGTGWSPTWDLGAVHH
ncbi:MAG: hypothetical protein RB191_12895 [Terriglobia bacterium]|nr:hypothetical protein [Terriglobia bacterium]